MVAFVAEQMMKATGEFFLAASWTAISEKHVFYLVLLYSVRLLIRRTAALAVTLTITFTARIEADYYFICNIWKLQHFLKGLLKPSKSPVLPPVLCHFSSQVIFAIINIL